VIIALERILMSKNAKEDPEAPTGGAATTPPKSGEVHVTKGERIGGFLGGSAGAEAGARAAVAAHGLRDVGRWIRGSDKLLPAKEKDSGK